MHYARMSCREASPISVVNHAILDILGIFSKENYGSAVPYDRVDMEEVAA